MIDTQLTLDRAWTIGERIGGGGFGQVYLVNSGEDEAVAKLVPKAPGADRELLFVNLADVRNVVPIIDSGEHDDYWVLIMPRAETSLREYLDSAGGSLDLPDAIEVLKDVCDALADLEGRVVHRDLKPENILRLNGHWCLADFGISRYAEATTAPDTQKFALSPPYAAPERWRSERATAATDIYAVGVLAYEMLAGRRPFPGPAVEEYRHQHLHSEPPHLEDTPAAFSALVDECLYKAPEARPGAVNLRARLDRVPQAPHSPGIARLEDANRAEVHRKGGASREQSEARTEAERRAALGDAAQRSFERISSELREAIVSAAPSATSSVSRGGSWSLRLGHAELRLSSITRHSPDEWGGWDPPAFDVVSHASLNLRIPTNQYEYEGRSHSLWFGDIQQAGSYAWFETAFMISPMIPRRGRQNPFALDPGEEAAKAVWSGMAEFQTAWPFTPLIVGDLGEFVDRWAGWFADAADGRLNHPGSMPERQPVGSWRR
ncbi:serine/threonine-protein kinase [Kribbella sp. VKM Ac-2527]|uniref:non-specific serine/threonine protein kinase n=1 Tax=Kribbella caucasensis TaxID=2512215 RepID=A0A4R6J2K7_9ACTN|nr:protein kinase [Kribbella sp. VKM Ac-2527]TDO29483.1 serine/threonine-protein kinase [Kribbella sp. VKM Ac-2527]